MIGVEEALSKILSVVPVLDSENKPILDCLGQVLAEDVYSPIDVPPHDNSAMDGYAVRAESIKQASLKNPKTLRIVGEVAAGHVPDVGVKSGQAVRIMTGGFIPEGADTVIPFEDTDEVERKQDGGNDENELAAIFLHVRSLDS